jgi:hypothetical protein
VYRYREVGRASHCCRSAHLIHAASFFTSSRSITRRAIPVRWRSPPKGFSGTDRHLRDHSRPPDLRPPFPAACFAIRQWATLILHNHGRLSGRGSVSDRKLIQIMRQ